MAVNTKVKMKAHLNPTVVALINDNPECNTMRFPNETIITKSADPNELAIC